MKGYLKILPFASVKLTRTPICVDVDVWTRLRIGVFSAHNGSSLWFTLKEGLDSRVSRRTPAKKSEYQDRRNQKHEHDEVVHVLQRSHPYTLDMILNGGWVALGVLSPTRK